MTLTMAEPVLKFHLSLNVSDIGRSLAFYRLLFGMAPAKAHDDYAKFELDDPPVVFSLVPRVPGSGGSLSHIGLRVGDEATLEGYRQRLEQAGLCTQRQDSTVCGYARQNKLWLQDPDGTFWEIYHIEEDVPPESVRQSLQGQAARLDISPAATGPVLWEHYVTEGVPARIPHQDASVDEVKLTGTFNASLSAEQRAFLLGETFRVLKPGGQVTTHGLLGDQPFPGSSPRLPGLAAMVARVPVHTEVIEALTAAGFVAVQAVKFTEKAWFAHDGVDMREVKLVARKPIATDETGERSVLYKGPFREVAAAGRTFPRGQRVVVPVAVWQQLRLGPTAECFVFLDIASPGCSTK
jgi:catechol 2,3-dioxygenase-like lactoylglutathione lyase family enzyme